MEKELRDYFKIDDAHSRIRGFVIIKDSDGNILVKRENMIVKSGRKMIFDLVRGAEGSSTIFKSDNILAAVSSSKTLTTSEMSLSGSSILKSDSGISVEISDISNNETELYTCFTIDVKSTKDNELNSLVLYSGETLFSRVVFDTIEISANSELTINYYIYF